MPPDRVFGLIEKKVRMHAASTDPEEYVDIMREFSNTTKLGFL